MDSKQSNEQRTDRLTEEIKAAYGFSDEQLIREMDDAIAHPDTSPELQAPENEFQLIMKKLEEMMKRAERQETPRISGVAGFTGTFPPARRRRKKVARMLLIAALLGVIGVGGVVSIGRSRIQYERVRSSSGDEVVVWNNTPVVDNKIENVNKAYDKIVQDLKIPVLKLSYIPNNMTFVKADFEENRAIITFQLGEHLIRLVEISDKIETDNAHVSDRRTVKEYFHHRLNTTITFSQNELQNGQKEYGAEVVSGTAYYYFSGIMEEEEFNKIVEKMYFD